MRLPAILLTVATAACASCASHSGVWIPPRIEPGGVDASARTSPASATTHPAPAVHPARSTWNPAADSASPLLARAGARTELLRKLRTQRVGGYRVEDEESLRATLAPLASITGLPIHVTRAAEEAALDAGVVFDFDLANPIGVRSLLDLVVDQAGGAVGWTIRDDLVLVTTKALAEGPPVLASYDVRALTVPVRDFPGPRLGLTASGFEYQEEEPAEPRAAIEEDSLVDLIQDNVELDSWNEPDRSIAAHNGVLLIRQTPGVHRRVATLLARLGSF